MFIWFGFLGLNICFNMFCFNVRFFVCMFFKSFIGLVIFEMSVKYKLSNIYFDVLKISFINVFVLERFVK